MSDSTSYDFYQKLAEERIASDLAGLKETHRRDIFENQSDIEIRKDLVNRMMAEWQLGVDSGLSEAGAFEVAVVECLPWIDPKFYK